MEQVKNGLTIPSYNTIEIQYIGKHKDDIFINKLEQSNNVTLPLLVSFESDYIELSFSIDFYDLILKQDIVFIYFPQTSKQKVYTISNRYEIEGLKYIKSNNQIKLDGNLNYINDFSEEFKFYMSINC